MTTFLKHFVRMYASTEAAMNSVERVSYYINELDQEPPKTSADPPPSDWPQKGELIVDNLSMRYRKGLPEVLRNIKFSVQPGEGWNSWQDWQWKVLVGNVTVSDLRIHRIGQAGWDRYLKDRPGRA